MISNRFATVAAFALILAFVAAPVRTNAGDKSSPPTPRVDLPLQVGFARGGTAIYITPEVGVDPSAGQDTIDTALAVAKGFNANFIPTNFATLPGSAAIRNIFVFTTQGNVLSATPTPPGPGNTNANYSPLWQVNLVTFNPNVTPTLLTSTAAITDAENANQVTVTPTPIIVECSVLFSLPPGGLLPASKVVLEALSASAGGNVTTRVILPLQTGFFDGATALYITPEVGVTPPVQVSSPWRKPWPRDSIRISFLRLSTLSPAVEWWMTSSCSPMVRREMCWPPHPIQQVPRTPIRTILRYGKSAWSLLIRDARAEY